MAHLDTKGYFLLPDGSKSSEHKAKSKKRSKKGDDKPEKAKRAKKEHINPNV